MHMEEFSTRAYIKLTTKHYSMSCHANMSLIYEQNIQSNMESLVFDSACGVRSKRNNSGSFSARIWTARRPGQWIRRNMMNRSSIVRYTGFGASIRMSEYRLSKESLTDIGVEGHGKHCIVHHEIVINNHKFRHHNSWEVHLRCLDSPPYCILGHKWSDGEWLSIFYSSKHQIS